MATTPVKIAIKQAYRDFNETDRRIADYVLENVKKVSRSSISDISHDLKLADSTVFQFAKKLGYDGYKDFKIALLTDEFDPNISIHTKISREDDEELIAKKVFESSIQSIKDTAKLIDGATYRTAVEYMTKSKRVVFFGFGGSNAVALDCYHIFLRSPIHVEFTQDFHMQLILANQLTSDDCAFIISHSGVNKDALEIAKLAKNNNCKVIALTTYPYSALARQADVVLTSTADETEYRGESLDSRISQLAIIDSLFVIIMFNNEAQAKQALARERRAIASRKE